MKGTFPKVYLSKSKQYLQLKSTFEVKSKSISYSEAVDILIRDSTGTGTGTVPGRNMVASIQSRNIFYSGAGPCRPFSLDI